MTRPMRLFIYSLGHLIIDCIGVYILFFQFNHLSFDYMVLAFLLYNLLAFGLQVVVGYYADRYQLYNAYVKIALLLAMMAIVILKAGLIPILIMTLSNALYHVGGGVLSKDLYEGKSMPLGVFVAPGALGVYLGMILANNPSPQTTILFTVLLVFALFLIPALKEEKPSVNQAKPSHNLGTLITLILMVIAIRAFVGSQLIFIWNTSMVTKGLLVGSVFLGKLLGGFLGDRYGLKKIGVAGLLGSLPLLLLGHSVVIFGLIGAVLFNLTMAITLFLIMEILSPYKGFAFGLTTLTLVLFFLPSQFGLILEDNIVYYGVIALSIVGGSFILLKVFRLYHKERFYDIT